MRFWRGLHTDSTSGYHLFKFQVRGCSGYWWYRPLNPMSILERMNIVIPMDWEPVLLFVCLSSINKIHLPFWRRLAAELVSAMLSNMISWKWLEMWFFLWEMSSLLWTMSSMNWTEQQSNDIVVIPDYPNGDCCIRPSAFRADLQI